MLFLLENKIKERDKRNIRVYLISVFISHNFFYFLNFVKKIVKIKNKNRKQDMLFYYLFHKILKIENENRK